MKFTLKDCQEWLEEHKDYVIVYDDKAYPLCSYTPEELLDILESWILPNYSKTDLDCKTPDELFLDFFSWNDGALAYIDDYMMQRNAYEVINALMATDTPAKEIREVIRLVLRFRTYTPKVKEAEDGLLNSALIFYSKSFRDELEDCTEDDL